MATIINNPSEGEGMSTGLVVGLIIGLLIIILFFVYALPELRKEPVEDNSLIEINVPGGNTNGSNNTPSNSNNSGY